MNGAAGAPLTTYHLLRIEFKRFRYALEFLSVRCWARSAAGPQSSKSRLYRMCWASFRTPTGSRADQAVFWQTQASKRRKKLEPPAAVLAAWRVTWRAGGPARRPPGALPGPGLMCWASPFRRLPALPSRAVAPIGVNGVARIPGSELETASSRVAALGQGPARERRPTVPIASPRAVSGLGCGRGAKAGRSQKLRAAVEPPCHAARTVPRRGRAGRSDSQTHPLQNGSDPITQVCEDACGLSGWRRSRRSRIPYRSGGTARAAGLGRCDSCR